MVIIIACAAVLLILLAVIAAVLLRKRSTPDGEHPTHAMTVRGLSVQIEMLEGMCYNRSLSFHLRRNLTIGTDKGCDLVLDDPALLPMHAVISRDSGVVTLRECGDTQNTYIGGMKIFLPNRLRSGDIVTLGTTSFRILFE